MVSKSKNTKFQADSYKIKTSKTGHSVPVINDVHLHSIYDPIREAEQFIKQHQESLEKKNSILVLGLGFGYHIQQLLSTMRKHHGENFRVVIIEPYSQVTRDCITNNSFSANEIFIHSGLSPQKLYNNIDLVKFLIAKPYVLAHPASFNLHTDYFKEFLSYSAPKKIADIKNNVSIEPIKQYLDKFNQEMDYKTTIHDQIINKHHLNSSLDFLLLALHHMTQTKPATTQKTGNTL